jgi:hypothetical protein
MNKLILEEIQRMDLLSRYDSSKTLSEQVKILSEADKVFPPEVQIPWDFYNVASKGGGTNPDGMLDALNKIDSVELFWKVNDGVIKNSGGMNIADVINDELENNMGQLDYVKKFQAKLKTLGITSTFTEYTNGWEPGTFKITTPAGKPDLTQTAAAGLPEWTKTFPCLSDRGTMKPSSNPKAVSFTNTNGEIYFFYDDKSFLYIYPDKKELKGTFGCVNNKLLIKKNDSDLQWSKDGGWQTIKTLKNVTVKPKTAVVIPTELKDKTGIMAFQDWLDNNAKGWATGYKEGIINRGQNGRGYGTYGPRTIAAWGKYKTNYLTSAAKLTSAPVAKPAVEPSAQPPG